MQEVWGRDIPVLERGALDGLDERGRTALQPTGDDVLVTRLRNGREVCLEPVRVRRLLCEAVRFLVQSGADPVVLLCTGTPGFALPGSRIIVPREIFPGLVRGLVRGPIGVMVPRPEQESAAKTLFGVDSRRVVTVAASPYDFDRDPTDFDRAARVLSRTSVEIIAMNCMGYTGIMADHVAERARLPALPASLATAHATALLVRAIAPARREG